jgi:hypothetical protein
VNTPEMVEQQQPSRPQNPHRVERGAG